MKEPGPDHPITIDKSDTRIVVRFAGTILCVTHKALVLREANYPPMLYLPRTDAAMDCFEPSAHVTHCPYKGDARYFHLVAGGARIENAVWSYEAPYPAMAQIKDHLAFYADKVDIQHVA